MHHIYHALFSAIAAHNAAPAHSTAHAVTPRNTPSGAFTLQEGRAITLQPQAAALLRVRQGGAWVTLPRLPGDHFLQAGEALPLLQGDCVVMEPWHARAHAPAHAAIHASATTEALYFDWDPVPMQVTTPAAVAPRGSRWSAPAWSAPRPSYCAAVRAPLADLRAALILGAGAATRLAAGFAVWGLGSVVALVLGTGLAARARTAHARASAAHGRMASGESMASSGAL